MDELLYTQEDIDEWIRTCEELQERNRELKQEIAEYKDKIEQGTLVELPCKVGDTVYCISNSKIEVFKVKKIVIGDEFELQCFDEKNVLKFTLRYFGDWLFFTREEAEKRLKELK